MKRWEELSRTEIVLRCLAAAVLLLVVGLSLYMGLSVALFCSQRERDIEYLCGMDSHVRFAYMITTDGRDDLNAPPNGPELLNRTRRSLISNATVLNKEEVEEKIDGTFSLGVFWKGPLGM